MTSGARVSAAQAEASARTGRPSASVLRISVVRPRNAATSPVASPTRWACSLHASTPVTRTGGRSSRTAVMARSPQPHRSCPSSSGGMAGGGRGQSPLSKVIPLPTGTTCGPASLPRYCRTVRLGSWALPAPYGQDPAEAARHEPVGPVGDSGHPADSGGLVASQVGDLMSEGCWQSGAIRTAVATRAPRSIGSTAPGFGATVRPVRVADQILRTQDDPCGDLDGSVGRDEADQRIVGAGGATHLGSSRSQRFGESSAASTTRWGSGAAMSGSRATAARAGPKWSMSWSVTALDGGLPGTRMTATRGESPTTRSVQNEDRRGVGHAEPVSPQWR